MSNPENSNHLPVESPADGAAGKSVRAKGQPGDPIREKATDALEFAKNHAESLLDDVKLRKRILDAKGSRTRAYSAAGKLAREVFNARDKTDDALESLFPEIDDALERLARITIDEKAAATEKPRPGFFDRLKQGAARAAGIAKHALERSLVERDLANACATLTECLLLNDERFAPLLAGEDDLLNKLATARTADCELEALERELHSRGGGKDRT